MKNLSEKAFWDVRYGLMIELNGKDRHKGEVWSQVIKDRVRDLL